MDNDFYLNFLYNLNSKKELNEKSEITKIIINKEISEKNIIKKNIKIKKTLSIIELEDNRKLIINEIPINILNSISIFIGDKTELIEFNFKEELLKKDLELQNYPSEKINSLIKSKFIIQKKDLNLIKEKTIIKSFKKVNPADLFKLKYKLNFIQPEIIKKYKEYILKIKKINLNQIHIIDSNEIKISNPNIKKEDYRIFKKLNLPIIKLYNNGFVIDTNINIFDEEEQIKLIKPFIIFEEDIDWDFEKEKKLRLYKDIYDSIYIKINTEEIIDIINNAEIINIKKELLIKEIKKITKIKLSTINESEYSEPNSKNKPLPLFKSKNKQRFIKIKNTKEFKELTGINFKLDFEYLNNILLLDLDGEKLNYKKLFLNPKIEKILEKINSEIIKSNLNNNQNPQITKKIINFQNIYELIIKINLFYSKNNNINYSNNNINNNSNTKLETIIFLKNTNIETLNQIKNQLKKILKENILLSIKYNKLPKFNDELSHINSALESIYNQLLEKLILYKNNHLSQFQLNKILNKKLNELILIIKNIKLEFSSTYFITKNIIISLIISKENNYKPIKEISNLFHEFYSNYNIKELEEIILFNLNYNKNYDNNDDNDDNSNDDNDKFKNIKDFKLKKRRIDKNLEEIIITIAKFNKLKKKKKNKLKLIIKNKENLYLNDIIELINNSKNENNNNNITKENELEINKIKFKEIIKPNKIKIKQTFPYSNQEIINFINKKQPKDKFEINLNNKIFRIDSKFIIKKRIYEEYKIILSNKFFDIITKK